MALERILAPSILESHFFDDIFEEMNRDICRMHHDLRHGMMRLTLPDPISAGGDALTKNMKSVRDLVVTEDDGSQEFRLNVDMNAFKPEEIKVKTVGNCLSIQAKHEEKTDDSNVLHEFFRSFTLPEGVNPESLSCSLSKDGVMSVKGPVENVAAIDGPPQKKQKTIQE